MKATRFVWQAVCCLALFVCFQITATAQDAPKPGPEHAVLKELVGDWDATMKMGPQESKGTMTYKMMSGDMWVVYDFKGEFMGAPFVGHGFMGYDVSKKKYVSVWIDSMGTPPMISEGTYDAAKKTMTEVGEAMGPDGKMSKMKMVTEMKSKDEMLFTMHHGDQPAMTITYKRKK